MVDAEEINRFVHPDNLWSLHDDARPVCLKWDSNESEDLFVGTHRGYERLGVAVQRTIRFDKMLRSLEITDRLDGQGAHKVSIPFHLASGVTVERSGEAWTLNSAGRVFEVVGGGDGWTATVEPCAVSPSYGIALPSQRLIWRAAKSLPVELKLVIRPTRLRDC
jgi:hypothetical protein